MFISDVSRWKQHRDLMVIGEICDCKLCCMSFCRGLFDWPFKCKKEGDGSVGANMPAPTGTRGSLTSHHFFISNQNLMGDILMHECGNREK